MRPVRTAVVSDFHLGVLVGGDVAMFSRARELLLAELSGADRVVILGDLLELRERPVPDLLRVVRPFVSELGEALEGKRLVLVPGNHDHSLAAPYLERTRLEGVELGAEREWPVEAGHGIAGRLAADMPEVELSLAYPGLRLRPDVYATHGHYLDVNLTVPRVETLAAALLARVTGRGRDCRSAADYEAVLAPMYAFHHEVAQGATAPPVKHSSMISRSIWARANGSRGSGAVVRFLLGRVTIPGAVAVLNRTGFGPFDADISGPELRRAGLRAMAAVVRGLGIEADHVLFGHTHRAGPLEGDERDLWELAGGPRLWNTGAWFYESVFLGPGARESPYWPGTVVTLEGDDPPRMDNLLRDVDLPAPTQRP
jgi:Calcineurin-like phosphoesterase